MKEDVAKKWTKALRSGKYVQAQEFLADSARKKHCCLGVLCELAIEDGVELTVRMGGFCTSFGDDSSELPEDVQEWAGMCTSCGEILDEDSDEGDTLTGLNDDGKTFDELATIIDEAWEKL